MNYLWPNDFTYWLTYYIRHFWTMQSWLFCAISQPFLNQSCYNFADCFSSSTWMIKTSKNQTKPYQTKQGPRPWLRQGLLLQLTTPKVFSIIVNEKVYVFIFTARRCNLRAINSPVCVCVCAKMIFLMSFFTSNLLLQTSSHLVQSHIELYTTLPLITSLLASRALH